MADLTLLDGGVATELQRRGIPVEAPWWTTRAVLTDQKRSCCVPCMRSTWRPALG
jgi:S-methylmethionine-dependent homocysteine/selenocysteine methylase